MRSNNRDLAALLRIVLPLGGLLLLSGCAGNVEGRMLHTLETFTGKSTASIDGDGRLSLKSSEGAQCQGPYRQVANDTSAEVGADATENGQATLTCSDGRTGSVMFMVGLDQAVGTGMLGRDIVTLTIGE